jgi:hypothetical protein
VHCTQIPTMLQLRCLSNVGRALLLDKFLIMHGRDEVFELLMVEGRLWQL